MSNTLMNQLRYWTRRRRKFIDPSFQIRVAIEILLHIFIFVSLLVILLYVSPLATLLSPFSLMQHQSALETLVALNLSKWPLFLILLLGALAITVSFSHRLAGPHYRIQNILRSFSERDLRGDTCFRKHDYLRPLAPILNELKETISADVASARKQVAMLRADVERLSRDGDSNMVTELNKGLDILEQRLSQYALDERYQDPSV